MKKILHIQVLPKMSGVQKVSYEIFRNLPNEEFEKYILFSDYVDAGDKNFCIEQFENIGVKVLLSKNLKREISLKDYYAFKEIYNLCKHYKFDIVHTHSTKPGVIGRIAARLAKIPLVIHTVHGIAYHKEEKFYKRIIYYLIEFFSSFFSHKIILVNNYYKKYYTLLKNIVMVIPNSIDFSKMPKIGKKNKRDITENLKLLYVGRLDKQKDPLTLIKAVNILINDLKRKNVGLTIVGDGEYYDQCEKLITEFGLEDKIEMLGWKSDVYKYYMENDIFCASSIHESFGIMFLEAGFYYLPTVATNVEGIPEVILDGKTGLLVPCKNAKALAQSIMVLVDNPSLREEMGIAAHNWVTTQFTIEKIMRKYKKVYSKNTA